MSVTYSNEAREHAKKHKLALFAFQIDGRHSKDGVTGIYSSDGPLNSRMARALWFFCFDLSKDKQANPVKAFNKWFPGGKPAPIPRAK